jgi:prophage antirepressor-like protein
MNAMALNTFGFGEQLIRTIERGGEPWFVAKDVCSALEIAHHNDAIQKLDDDEIDGVGLTDPMGRPQTVNVVSESGMYTLVLRCRDATKEGTLPHRFKRWVTREVLPQIRRTGSYQSPAAADEEEDDQSEPLIASNAEGDLNGMRTRLLLVREARIAFGPSAARRAWEAVGLPDLSDRPQSLGLRFARDPEASGEFSGWFDASCELEPGLRTRSMDLYDNYHRWCVDNGKVVRTHKAFSVWLGHCGFQNVKDGGGRKHFVGVKIKERPPSSS